jgi:tetratricopeptide (TPR) repeat protein
MKRALIALVFVAMPALAAEKWWDFYNRGVNAVRTKNYDVAVTALQRSLAEMPSESGSARARNESIVYVPHFWLGVAKFNLGDVDGALREWKTSEEQGAVQSTQYYSQLRDWVARAQQQKQRTLDSSAADSKRDANGAVGRAVSAQMDAVSAGADRSDRYRAAQRKLQEAVEAVNSAGTDARSYRRAAEIAQQAHDLFVTAAEEAKQQKAARPAVVMRPPPVKPSVGAGAPAGPAAGETPAPTAQRQPVKPSVGAGVSAGPPAGETLAATHAPPVVVASVVTPKPADDPMRFQLEAAYRAFAAGDLGASEQLLSRILTQREAGEVYLLRGCVRYTRSMLAKQQDTRGATDDFRAALKLNRGLRLDPAAFSPKLIAFFEQIKKQG